MKTIVENKTTKTIRVFNFNTLVCTIFEDGQIYGQEHYNSIKSMQNVIDDFIEACEENNFDYMVTKILI